MSKRGTKLNALPLLAVVLALFVLHGAASLLRNPPTGFSINTLLSRQMVFQFAVASCLSKLLVVALSPGQQRLTLKILYLPAALTIISSQCIYFALQTLPYEATCVFHVATGIALPILGGVFSCRILRTMRTAIRLAVQSTRHISRLMVLEATRFFAFCSLFISALVWSMQFTAFSAFGYGWITIAAVCASCSFIVIRKVQVKVNSTPPATSWPQLAAFNDACLKAYLGLSVAVYAIEIVATPCWPCMASMVIAAPTEGSPCTACLDVSVIGDALHHEATTFSNALFTSPFQAVAYSISLGLLVNGFNWVLILFNSKRYSLGLYSVWMLAVSTLVCEDTGARVLGLDSMVSGPSVFH